MTTLSPHHPVQLRPVRQGSSLPSSKSQLNHSLMADPETDQLKSRAAGGTEHSWCKAVPGGTGITALAILLSKAPDFSLLQAALHKLQNAHPILRSRLHFDPDTNTFSFVTSQNPYLQLQTFDLSSTSIILQALPNPETVSVSVSPFQLIFEHQLNLNTWHDPDPSSDTDLFFASVYTLSNDEWVVTLRLHTAVCDRTSAVALLRKLLELTGGGREKELREEEELITLGIEDMIPTGKANKPFWARGVNMLGYSLNSLRLTNLNFIDANSPRSSELVRLHLPADHTSQIIAVSQLHHCSPLVFPNYYSSIFIHVLILYYFVLFVFNSSLI